MVVLAAPTAGLLPESLLDLLLPPGVEVLLAEGEPPLLLADRCLADVTGVLDLGAVYLVAAVDGLAGVLLVVDLTGSELLDFTIDVRGDAGFTSDSFLLAAAALAILPTERA